jgi:hypothetical protein
MEFESRKAVPTMQFRMEGASNPGGEQAVILTAVTMEGEFHFLVSIPLALDLAGKLPATMAQIVGAKPRVVE